MLVPKQGSKERHKKTAGAVGCAAAAGAAAAAAGADVPPPVSSSIALFV